MEVPIAVYWIFTAISFAWVIVIYTIIKKLHADWKDLCEDHAEELENRRLTEFNPEPLVSEFIQHKIDRFQLNHPSQKLSAPLDLIKTNFLNLSDHETVTRAAITAVNTYGVGSASPPAFFGSSTPHLEAVELLKRIYNTQAGLLYAWGELTVNSVIATCVQPQDILFLPADISKDSLKHLSMTTQSTIATYKDPNDLSNVLKESKSLKSLFRNKNIVMVVEGISAQTGKVPRLPDLIKIANEFKVRIILDETLSFGVLGAEGNGILEQFHLSSDDVDVITGSLEPVFGVIGGFSVGPQDAMNVQQLTSKSYIYTAALPAFLASAFIAAQKSNATFKRFLRLEQVSSHFDKILKKLPELQNVSDEISPRKVLAIKDEGQREEVFKLLRDKYEIYLDKNECGLVMNLFHDLLDDDKMMQRIEDGLAEAEKRIQDSFCD